jgi:hypothetical protein
METVMSLTREEREKQLQAIAARRGGVRELMKILATHQNRESGKPRPSIGTPLITAILDAEFPNPKSSPNTPTS